MDLRIATDSGQTWESILIIYDVSLGNSINGTPGASLMKPQRASSDFANAGGCV